MRLAVAGQGDEGDVLAAGALDAAAADNALGVGEQDNLQEHGRRISSSARCIVAEADIEAGEIELVVDQVIHGVFEGAGQELPLQVNSEKSGTGVDVFVARHKLVSIARLMG